MERATKGAVFRQAWAETKADVRLDKPVRVVLALIAPVVSVLVVWQATGSWPWGSVAGVVALLLVAGALFFSKLVTVPVAMANEAREKNAQLEQRITELTAPPPRHPDGIYQHSAMVAAVRGSDIRLGEGVVLFSHVSAQGDFDLGAEFEFRDLRLQFGESQMRTEERRMGILTKVELGNVVCRVTGRLG